MDALVKQRIFAHDGFSAGDRVSHSKIGSHVGKIVFFVEFPDGVYVLVDYGERRRFENVQDIVPIREDIYSHNTRGEDNGTR